MIKIFWIMALMVIQKFTPQPLMKYRKKVFDSITFYTSQAICAPSRSQIFTGMFPVKNGCMANHLPVKSNLKTVIDYMGEAGYDVVLAGKGHVKPNTVFRWSKYFKSIDHRYLPIEEIDKFLDNTR